MMEERFAKEMERLGLGGVHRMIVALSGGMDSVVLLSLLRDLKGRSFSLEAAHVNHGMRAEAGEDQAFCRRLCAEWGIPLLEFEGSVADYPGCSPEEAARALRYGFLDSLCQEEGTLVALAHHREDQQETFFINLYRGSGSRGLSGMKAQREGYIRPLLKISKEEICRYAKKKDLPFVTDKTNEDTKYLRNFLRHRVFPLLNAREEGRFSAGLAAAMECLAEEDEALECWAKEAETQEAAKLRQLPRAVLKRVLDRQNGAPLDRVHFQEIVALLQKNPPAGQVELSRGRYFRLEYGMGVFAREEEDALLSVHLGEPMVWKGTCFTVHLEEINRPFTHFDVDCDKIKGNVAFRKKQAGDRFSPAKGGGTSRLQKRLKNDRVPRSRRDALWVLVDEQGQILWVEGYGASKEYCCDENSRHCWVIEIAKEE